MKLEKVTTIPIDEKKDEVKQEVVEEVKDDLKKDEKPLANKPQGSEGMADPLLKDCVSIYKDNYKTNHQKRKMGDLEDPEVLEQETGVKREVWKAVKGYTENLQPGVHYTDLTKDTVLLVINCPGQELSYTKRNAWWPDYNAFRKKIIGKKLFVHVKNGLLGHHALADLDISVLDVGPEVLEQYAGGNSEPLYKCIIKTALFRGVNLNAYCTAVQTVLTIGNHPDKNGTDYVDCQFPADVEIRNLLTGEEENMSANYTLYTCECENPEVFKTTYKYRAESDICTVRKLQTPLNFNSANDLKKNL